MQSQVGSLFSMTNKLQDMKYYLRKPRDIVILDDTWEAVQYSSQLCPYGFAGSRYSSIGAGPEVTSLSFSADNATSSLIQGQYVWWTSTKVLLRYGCPTVG